MLIKNDHTQKIKHHRECWLTWWQIITIWALWVCLKIGCQPICWSCSFELSRAWSILEPTQFYKSNPRFQWWNHNFSKWNPNVGWLNYVKLTCSAVLPINLTFMGESSSLGSEVIQCWWTPAPRRPRPQHLANWLKPTKIGWNSWGTPWFCRDCPPLKKKTYHFTDDPRFSKLSAKLR